MRTSKKDFTKEFEIRRKRFLPWAILILISVLGIIIILPILYATSDLDIKSLGIYGTIFAILLMLAINKVIQYSKCPNCKKYMGRDISKFCPICGVQIQK